MTIRTKLMATATPHVLTIVEDDLERIQQLKDEAWEKHKGEINFKGFRRGNVPRSLAERQIGYAKLYGDVAQRILDEGLQQAPDNTVGAEEATLQMFADKQPIVLQVTTWLKPEVHIAPEQYKGVEVGMEPVEIEEAEIDAIVERMKEGAATAQKVEREAQAGDEVVISFNGRLKDNDQGFKGGDAKEAAVVLGENRLLPEFETGITGMKADDTKTIEFKFPEQYVPTLAGKDVVFEVTVHEVRERSAPEVNDEFAQGLGYENLADCKTKLREDMELNKKQRFDAILNQKLSQKLVASAQLDPIPRCMIEQQIDIVVHNLLQNTGLSKEEYLKKAKATEEELRAQCEQTAATDVRVRLIFDKVAELEGVEVVDEDREARMRQILPQYPDMTLEQLREKINKQELDYNIRLQKAMKIVCEEAVIKEELPNQPPEALKEKLEQTSEEREKQVGESE